MTLRKIYLIYSRLPLKNEIHRELLEMTPSEFDVMWGPQESILADVADILQVIDWHFVASKSRSRPPKPKPYPRPDYGKTIRQKKAKEQAKSTPRRDRFPTEIRYVPKKG